MANRISVILAKFSLARRKIQWYVRVQHALPKLNKRDCPCVRQNRVRSLWKFKLYVTLIVGEELFYARNKNFGKIKIWYSFLFIIALFSIAPVYAQSPDILTPDRDPQPQPQPLPPSENPLNNLDAPPIPESVLDIPGTIVVEEFKFIGSTVFTQAELSRAIAPLVGKPISFARLVQAAKIITEYYVSQGYITSGAYLPAQKLNSGVVKIQIVEGSLSEIEVDITGGRLKPSYIRDRLNDRISTPLNINRLQEALQLLQLNPLIESLNAELSAGVKPGTNTLSVSVLGADTFTLQARLNNNRNPSIGTFERSIQLSEANLFGIGDRIDLGFVNTDGSDRYQGGYSLPLNSRNGTLGFNFSLTQNEIVELDFEDTDIDIESRNYDLTWRQPVIQTAKPEVTRELAISLTATRRESDISILDTPENISPGANDEGEIRTSILSLGQEWLQRNRQQVIAAQSQFNLGLDAFDATVDDDEPDSQFFAWRGQVSYFRLISQPKGIPSVGSTILVRSQLQLSADPLIPTEQFSLGGAATVRGYRQDALLTDNGFSASAELRLPIARLARINASLQFSPFIDFGTGWNTDGEATEFSTLLGTGIGLILQSEERLSARVDWGIPLLDVDNSDNTLQENGVYLQLQYDLF